MHYTWIEAAIAVYVFCVVVDSLAIQCSYKETTNIAIYIFSAVYAIN